VAYKIQNVINAALGVSLLVSTACRVPLQSTSSKTKDNDMPPPAKANEFSITLSAAQDGTITWQPADDKAKAKVQDVTVASTAPVELVPVTLAVNGALASVELAEPKGLIVSSKIQDLKSVSADCVSKRSVGFSEIKSPIAVNLVCPEAMNWSQDPAKPDAGQQQGNTENTEGLKVCSCKMLDKLNGIEVSADTRLKAKSCETLNGTGDDQVKYAECKEVAGGSTNSQNNGSQNNSSQNSSNSGSTNNIVTKKCYCEQTNFVTREKLKEDFVVENVSLSKMCSSFQGQDVPNPKLNGVTVTLSNCR
jgi:hypothetical protein